MGIVCLDVSRDYNVYKKLTPCTRSVVRQWWCVTGSMYYIIAGPRSCLYLYSGGHRDPRWSGCGYCRRWTWAAGD